MNLKELCLATEIDGYPITNGFVVIEGMRLRLSEYLVSRAQERGYLPPVDPDVDAPRQPERPPRRHRLIWEVRAEAQARREAKEAERLAEWQRRFAAQEARRQQQPQRRLDLFPPAGKEL